MKSRSISFLAQAAVLAMALLACGCGGVAQPEPGIDISTNQPVVRYSAVDTSHPRAKLIIGSQQMVGSVVILNPKFRDVGRMTQAQVTVQNLTENRYSVEYKFDWEDAQGFKIEGPAVWHRLTLTPHMLTNLSSTGKTPQAKNIVFTLRFPDSADIEFDKQIQRQQK